MEWVLRRSGMNVEHAMDDGCVRLRGLPFGCSKDEIADFFKGIEVGFFLKCVFKQLKITFHKIIIFSVNFINSC